MRFYLLAIIILVILSIVFSQVNEKDIEIPVKAYVISDPSEYYTSSRDEKNINKLFEQVNRIWSQADIFFYIDEIVYINVTPNIIPNTLNGYYEELSKYSDLGNITIFFSQNLNGINGIAITNLNSALVADYTTVNDFRTTAHEIGHLFRLQHVAPSNRLMARGRNGELLAKDEIDIVRQRLLNTVS